MNIGIFGDSYADGNLHHNLDLDPRISWTYLLLKNFNGKNFARSGTSTWWSFEQFIKNKDNFDIIIFCYSSPGRWPVLPDDCIGSHVDIFNSNNNKVNQYIPYYFDLFNENFFEFIQLNIFRSVNEICKNEKKYLINVQTVSRCEQIHPTSFPSYVDLQKVALNEEILVNGNILNINKINTEGLRDLRVSHLCNGNHYMLYNFFKKNILNQEYNVNLNCFDDMPWVKLDPGHISNMYKESIDAKQL